MKSLITGITGQDGSYLAELLLSKGHEVAGFIRRHADCDSEYGNVSHIKNKIKFYYGDLTDVHSISKALKDYHPDMIFNLAAQSHVGISSKIPQLTMDVNATGVLNILEQAQQIVPDVRFYQASSSEQFGNNIDDDGFQRETTPMSPVSPYASAKLCAYNLVRHYRSAYGMFCCNGILFNHESPRRGKNFVTQKVVQQAVEIKFQKRAYVELGNLGSKRDWGDARDYVKAMLLMMEHSMPDDYVIATGKTHSITDLCRIVFTKLELDDEGTWEHLVKTSDEFKRPQELHTLKGDASKARNVLGWEPTINFEKMLEDMIEGAMKKK